MAIKNGNSLTLGQIDNLAGKLHGTRSNVYQVATALFGIEVGEEIFDLLEANCEIFRCEICGEWLALHDDSEDFPGQCRECVEGDDSFGEDDS